MAEFRLPDLGEGVHEGQIIRLRAKEGEFIREDAPFMEVETDKAAVEIPAPFTGTIEKWHVKEGQVVNVGDVMVTYQVGQVSDLSRSQRLSESLDRSRAPARRAGETVHGSESRATSESRVTTARRTPASPATRKLARSMGIDIDQVSGSGPGGRVTRADVEGMVGQVSDLPSVGQVSDPSRSQRLSEPLTESRTPAGRAGETSDGSESRATDAHGEIRIHPLSQARKTIARNMVQSWTTIPHVTDQDDADITELDRLRKGYPSAANNNRKLTLLPFIVRAVAQALTRHPEFNAAFDEEQQAILYRDSINIAIGVHTERGLVAPVIRAADTLSVIEISDALDGIVEKARSATFSVNETRGGTYTISNAGAFGGSRYSTPIITPGQCAVLAAGRAKWMPWVVENEMGTGRMPVPPHPVTDLRVPATRVEWLPPQIMPRLILPLSHSFDHRIADGGQEIAFLQDIIGQLENPARLMF